MYTNTAGNYNTAYGIVALYNNTTGIGNVANGYMALLSNTTGAFNTAYGLDAMRLNTEGNRNTAVGFEAMSDNFTGSYNTAVGYNAGPIYSDLSNATALGNNTQNTASNQVRIGNSAVTSIGGYVGLDRFIRWKVQKRRKSGRVGSDFIRRLRPVSYRIDRQTFNDFLGIKPDDELIATSSKISEYKTGFIAQEVEQLAREIGFTHFGGVDAPKNDGDYYGIRYSEFVVPLVKAVQELSDIVEKQQWQNRGAAKANKHLVGQKE